MDHANVILQTYYVALRLSEDGGRYRLKYKHQDISEVYRQVGVIQKGAPLLIEDIQKIGWLRLV